jgi:hypothetical protein
MQTKTLINFSDGNSEERLSPHAAKQYAQREVETGKRQWAIVYNREGQVIATFGEVPANLLPRYVSQRNRGQEAYSAILTCSCRTRVRRPKFPGDP